MFFGKLQHGLCKYHDFTQWTRNITVQAGPCGKIEFAVYKKKGKKIAPTPRSFKRQCLTKHTHLVPNKPALLEMIRKVKR